MTRIIIGFFVGVLVVALGLGVLLDARSMATTWMSVGTGPPGSRTGFLDPGQETLYRMLGFAILGFGFLVTAMALNHWMSGRDVELRRIRGIA